MATAKAGGVVRRRISLFSREASDLLTSSSVTLCPSQALDPGPEEEYQLSTSHAGADPTCLSCLVKFSSREDQVEHYRLDWHRYNVKRRLKGLEGVDQGHFERLAGDLSSISGSESDSSEDEKDPNTDLTMMSPRGRPTRSPYLHFSPAEEGPTHSIYRCIVSGAQSGMESNHKLSDALQALREPQVWIILMRSGGHFAGAIFRGAVLEAHKTFHRYTVRAKRGTAQSIRDGQQGGHQPKSAGASLRRYNEAALMTEMRDLMTSWSAYAAEASCVFIRIPRHSRRILVGDKGDRAPFLRGDPRVRDLPFATRRPTLKEAKAVHARLATIYVGVVRSGETRPPAGRPREERLSKNGGGGRGEKRCVTDDLNADVTDVINVTDLSSVPSIPDPDLPGVDSADSQMEESKIRRKKKGKNKPDAVSSGNKEPGIPSVIQQLLVASDNLGTGTGDQVTTVTDLLKDMGLKTIEERCDTCKDSLQLLNTVWNGSTVLHRAASKGYAGLIPVLLLYGADPAIRNQSGQTPYLVAQTKEVRDSFRRFMAVFPGSYDYERAHVPSPLTQDMERERRDREAGRRKEKKKARQQKLKEKQCELTQQKTAASLSEREKRAMAAEKRIQCPSNALVNNVGVCSRCGHSLVGVVPFERLDFKYCSMECLRQHRKQLAVT